MMTPSYSAIARNRSLAFWFLSECFLIPPDADRLKALYTHTKQLSAGNERFTQLCRSLFPDSANNDQVLQLRREHTRLFGGIKPGYGPPPPYEALYRELRFMGSCSEAVQSEYAAAGYARLAENLEAPDHLGIELRFMALLAYAEATAWEAKKEADARANIIRQQRFLSGHLQPWVPSYCKKLGQETTTDYYCTIAHLTAEAIEQAHEQLLYE